MSKHVHGVSDDSDRNDADQVGPGSNGEFFEFAMGDHTARFPRDRAYVTNHMWAMNSSNGIIRFGLTSYAVRLLQDVYFLDWLIDPGTHTNSRGHIGSIESKKAESDLFSPLAGTLTSINQTALDDPSIINADAYGEGWLIEILADQGQVESLLLPGQYAEHLVAAWDVAQKTIKGQANI